MNQQTQVKEMRVRSRAEKWMKENVEWTEVKSESPRFSIHFLQIDRLVRNFAVVAGLVMVTMAVRSSKVPEVQSVFGAIQESAGMRWDESVGKLSFVNSFMPEEIQQVWNENTVTPVFSPVNGTVIHEWSANEPYLLMSGNTLFVQAAAEGEVMSIAHGPDEEIILRLRHENGVETVYGNLQNCFVEIGQLLQAGQQLGSRMEEKPLAFETRVDGRSVSPVFYPSLD